VSAAGEPTDIATSRIEAQTRIEVRMLTTPGKGRKF
jgi:hypothetical protein